MVYNNYSDRVLGKLENLNKIYAELMYAKSDSLNSLMGLQTKDHLRTPPTVGPPNTAFCNARAFDKPSRFALKP